MALWCRSSVAALRLWSLGGFCAWTRRPRSPGTGYYSTLQSYDLPYPEAIFELSFFFHNPKPFFTFAKELYPGNYRPNTAHYFLRLLHDKGLLLRLYTQNIDGLERASGIPASKLVEAHGSFASATCTVCRRPFPGEDFWADVMVDSVPRCRVCAGVVKPDIVFFGEPLPRGSCCIWLTSPWQICCSSLGPPWRFVSRPVVHRRVGGRLAGRGKAGGAGGTQGPALSEEWTRCVRKGCLGPREEQPGQEDGAEGGRSALEVTRSACQGRGAGDVRLMKAFQVASRRQSLCGSSETRDVVLGTRG
uniref:Deacetylase sirtuin-type domain-containing protein n=1 Tax=Sus scrofa TaxID=9823 RepID=A0A4X1VZI5_PIG